MVDPLDILARIRRRTAQPSVKDLARLHPDRTVVHTISWSEWFDEQQRQERLYRAVKYPGWEHIEFGGPATNIFEGRLHDIAEEHGIDDYDIASEQNQDGDIEITMVFASTKDAMVFKMALP